MRLLQSALARPRKLHARRRNPDFAALAAAYTAGIIRNHPFFDGNKRTGFVVGVLFLEINGHDFCRQRGSLRAGRPELGCRHPDDPHFAAWLRANLKPR